MIQTDRELNVGIKANHNVHSLHSLAGVIGAAATLTSAVWPSANLAIYCPIVIHEQSTVKRLLAAIGSVSSGNIDIGIYNESGTRLASSGSIACGTADNNQVSDIGDILLDAGRYYLALAVDNTTARIVRCASGAGGGLNRICGFKEQAAAFPLPATATFSESATRDYCPFLAMTLET